MPLTGYLHIPDIPGESKTADHEGEIDIHDIHWQFAREAAAITGRGRSRARSEVSPLVVSKLTDAASPYLILANLQGKAIPEITLSLRKDSGDAHLDYLVITLTNCMITGVELGTLHSDGTITEEVAITSEQIKVLYTVQADDHSAGDEHEIEFDIVRGV